MKKTLLVLMLLSISSIALCEEFWTPDRVDMMTYFKDPNGIRFTVPVVRPIGWSPKGHFAYVVENAVEGRGGVLFSQIIMSAVTDKVLWRFDDDWENGDPGIIDASMKRSRSKVSPQLEKYNIIQGGGTKLYKFPLKHGGYTYSPDLVLTKKAEPHPFLGTIQSMAAYIKQNYKKKRITRVKEANAFSYWVAGYFHSPYEDRILVVIGEETWGFEGTAASFIYTGCRLGKGFK